MKQQIITLNSNDIDNKECGKKLVKLLKNQGYCIISNHNVPTNLLVTAMAEWKKFFSDDRRYSLVRTDVADEGYIPISIETAAAGLSADYKELYQAHYGTKLPDIIDTKSTSEIFDGLTKLGEQISNLIDIGLPDEIRRKLPGSLFSMSSGCGNHMLRVVHYPPVTDDFTGSRAEAHTDICLFTFIFGKLFAGLEIQNLMGKWFTLNCDDDSIVIFTSEMLEIYTKKYFKAVKHRVPINLATCRHSRYSIPFGYHPFREAKLTSTLTAGEYLRGRLIEMGYDGNQLDLTNY
jgi:isopenicillin N synthase-like dioxygenase